MPHCPTPGPSPRPRPLGALIALSLLVALAGPAGATSFTYQLANHPDGAEAPPLYGLRLDELFDVTAGHDVFSFDFEHASADMTLVYDDGDTPGDGALGDDTVHIFGTVYGGLDTGGAYGDPTYAGLWDVDFTYTTNFTSAGASGSDIEVSPDAPGNNGTITPGFAVGGDAGTLGVAIALLDEDGSQGFSFRFNNTDDHRLGGHGLSGPETFVGWGWLSYEDGHVSDSDWLFTGTVIPEPGSGLLVAAGLAGLAARQRRR